MNSMKDEAYICHKCDFYSMDLKILLEHIDFKHGNLDETPIDDVKKKEANDGVRCLVYV